MATAGSPLSSNFSLDSAAPTNPTGSPTISDAEARRRACDAELLGEFVGAGIGDIAMSVPSGDAGGDHVDVRDDARTAGEGFGAAFEGRFVEDEGFGVFEVGRGVDHTLRDGAGEWSET